MNPLGRLCWEVFGAGGGEPSWAGSLPDPVPRSAKRPQEVGPLKAPGPLRLGNTGGFASPRPKRAGLPPPRGTFYPVPFRSAPRGARSFGLKLPLVSTRPSPTNEA